MPGQRTDGYEVYAGRCDIPDRLEREAATGLERGPPCDHRDRLAQALDAHVVEQDHRRPGGERLLHLLQVPALDLERQPRRVRKRQPDRFSDAAGERRMVLLDQDRVVEAGAVVAAAARDDGLLLEQS